MGDRVCEMADVSSWITGKWDEPEEVRYNTRDLLLYSVGIGCGQAGPKYYNDLRYVYEQNPKFCAFPTFPVSLAMKGHTFDVDTPASSNQYLGKVRPTQGPFKKPTGEKPLPITGARVGVDYERYIVKVRELPVGDCKLAIRARRYGISQKKGGVVTEREEELYDPTTGTVYYRFINAGFLIGGKGVQDAGKTNAVNVAVPNRAPDFVDELKISQTAHLTYRLCGDYNPLHVDPESPMVKGFPEPILMGLCTLGHAARSVLNTVAKGDPARFKALKLRFASPVLPGQTLLTEMWTEADNKVLFICKVKETGKVVISNSFMELTPAAQIAKL